MKKFLLSTLSLLACTFGFTAAGQTSLNWSFKTEQTNISKDVSSPLELISVTTPEGLGGTWTVTYTGASGQVVKDKSKGPRFGSKNAPLESATLSLSNSPIPEDAVITEAVFKVTGNAGSSQSTWNLTIGGETIGTAQSMSGGSETALTWSNINATAGEIAFVLESVKAGLHFGEVSITYTSGGGGEPEPEVGLGEVTGQYGSTTIASNDEVSVVAGTEFTFSSANAETISISGSESGISQTATGSTLTWTATDTIDLDLITVTATKGEEVKTLEFLLTVTEPITPEIGSTIDITPNAANTGNTSTKYVTSDMTYTVDGVTVIANNVNPSELQIRGNKENSEENFYIYNTTPINGIVTVVVTLAEGSKYNPEKTTFTTGTAADNLDQTGTYSVDGQTVTYSIAAGAQDQNFFKLSLKNKATSGFCYIASIVVNRASEEKPADATLEIDGTAIDPAEGLELTGENVTIRFSAPEGVNIWYKFVPDTPAATSDYQPEDTDYIKYDGNGVELSQAGTLYYYTEKDGATGEVQTLAVTGKGTTGIREVVTDGAAGGAIYDLQGRRVLSPRSGSIYISNGKKIRM